MSASWSRPTASMHPRARASPERVVDTSSPLTCQPRERNPRAIEPPISPSPTTFARFTRDGAYRPGRFRDLPVGTVADASRRTSSVVSSRHSPGFSRRSVSGPMRTRTSRRTGWPTASHILRICRLRPSWMAIRSTPGEGWVTFAGAVTPSSRATPSRSVRMASGLTLRPAATSTSARYSFSTPIDGWATRLASSPSLVSSRRPSVSASSRPTGNTRGLAGTRSTTVRRPCVSRAVVTTPAGLLSR